MERVLSFEEALAEVLRHAAAVPAVAETEEVELWVAHGRVLADDVQAPRDQPAFDRSTRDGYAVRSGVAAGGARLKMTGTVRAGEVWRGADVASGECVEIMTGAPIPAGADAVLMVEHAALAEGVVVVSEGRALCAGENVVPRGAEAREGDVVLRAGTVMDAAAVAVAASCGCGKLRVVRKPMVGLLATGDELVGLDEVPEAWQIYNSNTYALRALAEFEGGFGGMMPTAKDTLADLRLRIGGGSMFDLLVLSGGVSMGKYDLVEEVLREHRAEFFFTGAKIQPGKPVVFGRLPKPGAESGWTYFFGLPGNPVSTQVCFHLFVAPMLRALCGRKDLTPRFVEATVSEAFEGKRGLVRFLPAVVEGDFRGVSVRPVPWQGSGDVAGNARATEYCVVEEQGLRVGDVARVLLR